MPKMSRVAINGDDALMALCRLPSGLCKRTRRSPSLPRRKPGHTRSGLEGPVLRWHRGYLLQVCDAVADPSGEAVAFVMAVLVRLFLLLGSLRGSGRVPGRISPGTSARIYFTPGRPGWF